MSGWDVGSYEITAERLEPAAPVVVDALGLKHGARVLDVACGTGNAALEAARRGFAATGADSAPRLIDVARQRAAAERLDARFDVADATALPYEDGRFDGVVSVFGVIFAEPDAVAAELLRLVRPGGRIAITTWVPGGPSSRFMEVVREAFGAPADPPRWSSNAFVAELFAGREVAFARHEIALEAASPAAYLQEQFDHHPMWQPAQTALAEAGKLDDVLARLVEIFEAGNENPAAFRTTSRYDVVTVTV